MFYKHLFTACKYKQDFYIVSAMLVQTFQNNVFNVSITLEKHSFLGN